MDLSFFEAVFLRMLELFAPPFQDADIFWAVLPLFLGLVILELYFGMYREEELGWNSATGNGLVLTYTGFTLFQYYSSNYFFHIFDTKALVSLSVLLFGLFILIVSFFHILPRRLDFGISSILVVDYVAYLGIIFVHGTKFYLDLETLAAVVLGFMLLTLLFRIIHHFEPKRG